MIKKIIWILFIIICTQIHVHAYDWTPIGNNWQVDLSSAIHTRKSSHIWAIKDVSNENIFDIKNQKICQLAYFYKFLQKDNSFQIVKSIAYDIYGNELYEKSYPNGNNTQPMPLKNNDIIYKIRNISLGDNDISNIIETNISQNQSLNNIDFSKFNFIRCEVNGWITAFSPHTPWNTIDYFYIDNKKHQIYDENKKQVFIKEFSDEYISFAKTSYYKSHKYVYYYDINRYTGRISYKMYAHPTNFFGSIQDFIVNDSLNDKCYATGTGHASIQRNKTRQF